MLKFYISDPFARRFLIGLALFTMLCISIGIMLEDAKGFLGNLSAGLTGNVAAILVVLLLVDRLIEYRMEQQWSKVRNFTLGK